DADYQSRKNKRANDRFDQIQENVAKKVDIVPPFRPYPPDRDTDNQPNHNLRGQRWAVPGARWSAHGDVSSHAQRGLPQCAPRIAVYDLDQAGRTLKRDALLTRAEKSLWRYRELLPVPIEISPVSLSEGGTPLLRAGRFGVSLQTQDLWIKDESQNPTQSFKA